MADLDYVQPINQRTILIFPVQEIDIPIRRDQGSTAIGKNRKVQLQSGRKKRSKQGVAPLLPVRELSTAHFGAHLASRFQAGEGKKKVSHRTVRETCSACRALCRVSSQLVEIISSLIASRPLAAACFLRSASSCFPRERIGLADVSRKVSRKVPRAVSFRVDTAATWPRLSSPISRQEHPRRGTQP